MEIYENKIHLTIRQGDLHVNTEHINDNNQQTLSLSFGRWFKGDVGPIGPPGLDGNDGKDAQINGRNAIVIAAGENISITDIEDGIQIAANGGALFLAEVNEAGTQLITPFDDILEAYNNGNVVYLKIPFFGVFVLAPLVAINNDSNMIMFDAHLATPDIHLDGALACTSDGQVEFHTYLPNWNEIQNKPTKLSEFENDTQFITEQSLEGYATESWVAKQHYLTEHQDISGKVDRSDLATVATTGNYNDLSNKPTYTASEVGARPSTWTPTKSDVGLGNVGNFKAVSTVANQGLSTTEQANSRNNINAQELLVSGTNIKTINGNSLLGNGNIVIEGGSGGSVEEVYIGTSEPTDPNIKMWIVPNGDADSIITLSEVEQLINNKLNDVLNELY